MDAVVAALTKKYGVGAIGRLGDPGAYPEIKRVVPTGLKSLDEALGVGGFPLGKLIEVSGPPGSGKTTLAKHLAARAQAEGIVPIVMDTEHSGVAAFDQGLGMDLMNALGGQPSTLEEVFEYHDTIIEEFGDKGVAAIILWDSIPTAPMAAELEIGYDEEARMAARAGFFAKKLPKLMDTIKKKGTDVVGLVWINQIRSKVGAKPWERQTYRPGGWALDHGAHCIIEMQGYGMLKRNDEPYGIKTRAKIVKSRIAPPFREAELEIHWDPPRLVEAGADKPVVRQPMAPRRS